MLYPLGAAERAMKVHEIIMRALDGQLTWIQAAEILGRSPGSIRRLRRKLQRDGYDGLFDRRWQVSSPKRAPRPTSNVCSRSTAIATRASTSATATPSPAASTVSASATPSSRKALQSAGFVPKHRPRGRHRRRREPRPASASSCISTAVAMAGSPWSPTSGSLSSLSSTMRPSACSMPNSGPAGKASWPS
jgi:hypothetical protein